MRTTVCPRRAGSRTAVAVVRAVIDGLIPAPGRRVVISCTIQPLPSGSSNDRNDP